jgi:hypothetical protein
LPVECSGNFPGYREVTAADAASHVHNGSSTSSHAQPHRAMLLLLVLWAPCSAAVELRLMSVGLWCVSHCEHLAAACRVQFNGQPRERGEGGVCMWEGRGMTMTGQGDCKGSFRATQIMPVHKCSRQLAVAACMVIQHALVSPGHSIFWYVAWPRRAWGTGRRSAPVIGHHSAVFLVAMLVFFIAECSKGMKRWFGLASTVAAAVLLLLLASHSTKHMHTCSCCPGQGTPRVQQCVAYAAPYVWRRGSSSAVTEATSWTGTPGVPYYTGCSPGGAYE